MINTSTKMGNPGTATIFDLSLLLTVFMSLYNNCSADNVLTSFLTFPKALTNRLRLSTLNLSAASISSLISMSKGLATPPFGDKFEVSSRIGPLRKLTKSTWFANDFSILRTSSATNDAQLPTTSTRTWQSAGNVRPFSSSNWWWSMIWTVLSLDVRAVGTLWSTKMNFDEFNSCDGISSLEEKQINIWRFE